MSTAFKLSADTKTASVVWVRPAKKDALPNAFGVTAGSHASCVLATDKCEEVCYVEATLRYPAVRDLLEHNWQIVQGSDDPLELADKFEALFTGSLRRQDRYGIERPLFRMNWAGEIATEAMARGVVIAARRVPRLSVWLYTRAWFFLPTLAGSGSPANLRVLLSCDTDNYRAGHAMAELYGLQVAYMGDVPDRGRRVLTCPASRQGNVVESRKSPSGHAGICSVCRACVDTVATPDIHFPIH